MTKILVFVQTDENGAIKASEEIVSYCVNNFQSAEINAAAIVQHEQLEAVRNSLSNAGLNNLYLLINDSLFSTEIYSGILSEFLQENGHDVFLISATPLGRELAPRIASRLDIGLTADCTEIGIDENNMLLATRPTYGGKLMATILSKTFPQFATVRPGALKYTKCHPEKNTNIIEKYPEIDSSKLLSEVISFQKKNVQNTDWTTSDIIIAGGRGLGSKENFELIYKLCELTGAKPAASRCAVELGWAEPSIQVGQTGFSVSPKLYIAFGISGAMQHLVGIENADKIIAVNTDKNAPIMQSSDIAVTADAVETLKTLISDS